ncbi:MAG: UvrABC system protein A [Parcubacteria group bacterium GW2011_GWC1_38_17]|nr:MAG: UvrABC system protein A [Parcubacteria group bacterium GW2011_GWC2_36_17]KKQ58502.1 MAG: UvrABC system protein A [Parcubacteria group bacterium GW2011_GWC1_38_17]
MKNAKNQSGNHIIIRGAKTHNLKSINLDIPRNKLVVITGLSGSGKSSLAFDTIYAEGQRRYVESLSSYARQFLGVMDKPEVDRIEGLSPAIAIDQKSVSGNPRSTVGTITEIYDYLRILFARIGKPYCPNCGKPISKQSATQIVDKILSLKKGAEIAILAPIVKDKKGEHKNIIDLIERSGYLRARIDGQIHKIDDAKNTQLDKNKKHKIDAVIDRFILDREIERSRIADSVEKALKLGEGTIIVSVKSEEGKVKSNESSDIIFSEKFACQDCGVSLPEIEPRIFSFNSPHGACPECTGLGKLLKVNQELVVPSVNLTLAEGAIKPWGGAEGWHFDKIRDLAEHYKFSINEPFKNLPEKIRDLILRGEKTTGGLSHFEGVVSYLERKWKETDSDWTRGEIEKYMVVKICPLCEGRRLKKESLAILIEEKNIQDISSFDIAACVKYFFELQKNKKFNTSEQKISTPLIKEILTRLQFLMDVGLEYLTLNRESETLSGGEAQRIRLATQIGSQLVGVLYILDEPSIGLHPRDHYKLIKTLKDLRDLGNSVLVVEHDKQTILESDWIVDIGPGAGKHGGNIIFEGSPEKLKKAKTLTAQYINKERKIERPRTSKGRRANGKENYIEIIGATENNLKNVNVKIPLQKFVCVTGVSGSGKSTLIDDILAKSLRKEFYGAKEMPGVHKEINGVENLDKIIHIDQSSIGRTPRSNAATYTNIFTPIRDLFSQSQEAKIRGYKQNRFSFNLKGGRCESCEGQGYKTIEMHFLPDVLVECEECRATRYNKETLEIEYNGKNIADVLKMTVEEASEFFKNIPQIKEKLKLLNEVGLSYIELGQPAPTLSGGEAQRIKLSTELAKKATGKTLYILDEPTTGLHFDDTAKLLGVLHKLVEMGNSIIVIEHNMDIIKNADWIIDMGPEGGNKGGQIVAEGAPKDIMKVKASHTGQFLKKEV